LNKPTTCAPSNYSGFVVGGGFFGLSVEIALFFVGGVLVVVL
jgi:hypothetical protein